MIKLTVGKAGTNGNRGDDVGKEWKAKEERGEFREAQVESH